MTVLYRPQFWIDVEDGIAYLAKNASTEVAISWHEQVFATLKMLETQPQLGRVRNDLMPNGIRSLIIRRYPRYLLFYRLVEGGIEVLRIKHGMMDLPRLFELDEKK